MFTYQLAKARQNELLREAAQDRLAREAKRAKRGTSNHWLSKIKGWVNRRLVATHTRTQLPARPKGQAKNWTHIQS
jgi:hypothetical protein